MEKQEINMLKRIQRLIYKKLYKNLDKRKECIIKAADEQGLTELMQKLQNVIDDDMIINQYTHTSADTYKHPYWINKLRAQHSFQISMVLKAIELFNLINKDITIVDIGDSAGTHILYLKKILGNIRSLSVNLDKNAVDKIQKKGLEAVCCRAEELDKYNIKPDIFISFQMLEHIISPIHFLKSLSDKSECDRFVITIPYLKNSRAALYYIRNNSLTKQVAENTHVFEFSPEDWKLIFKFSGWKPVYEKIYYQYPKNGIYKLIKSAWRKYDFEGFYGVILEKDDTYKNLYQDWD
jgi:hypothetical protein